MSLTHLRQRGNQPNLRAATSPASKTFGNSEVAIRGTRYRNQQGFCGTWINECLNQPLFNETTTVFEVNKNKKVRKEDQRLISRETLTRLNETRPDHKEIRQKYDVFPTAKNNKTMTFEDNIHQGTVETNFQTSLRPDIANNLLSPKKVQGVQSEPSFYNEDIDKWMNQKFKNSQKTRQDAKSLLAKSGCFNPLGTANQNAKRPELKRRNSRCSAPTFNHVDFEYTGNTAAVNHLIQHAKGPKNHAPSDLNFELNLRTWRADSTSLKQERAFQYPQQALKTDPVQLFKGQFMPLKGRMLLPEYREDYPDKNYNNVRCFKTALTKNQKVLLQWQVSLREAGGESWTWDKTQKSRQQLQKSIDN